MGLGLFEAGGGYAVHTCHRPTSSADTHTGQRPGAPPLLVKDRLKGGPEGSPGRSPPKEGDSLGNRFKKSQSPVGATEGRALRSFTEGEAKEGDSLGNRFKKKIPSPARATEGFLSLLFLT
jgi:hypothetical protein